MDLKYIGGDIPWSLPFGDHFNSQKPPTELEIIARRHGFEQLITSENNSKWANAGVFFTNKTIDSNLTEVHHTDFHDHHNHTFCYLCSINPHEHERTKPRDEYKRRKLIPYKNPKARSSSSSNDRIVQDSSSDLISYRFIIRTGTQKNSGTRAQVFLYMYGTEKNWSSIHLQGRINQNSLTSIDGFPSGSIRTFCLKGPDIGQLHHLNVNLVGSRSDKEWFLKEIEITNLNTSATWLCEFNCWLPKTDEQESNQIEISVPRQTKLSLSIYILTIRTGEKSFVGTDANIQIIIRGSASQTHRLALTSNRANLFEQNQLDTFAIVGWDLGDLLEITVESDRSHVASDWDIKEMTMWKIIPSDDHKQSYVYFPFNTWLGRKMSTIKAKKEVYPSTDQHLKGPLCYQVVVKTGKAMNAGTDANVFLIIYGTSGRTAIHQLNNRSKNDFERNSLSEFIIMDIDVGKIDRIKIWHDNSNPGPAWFLDSVIIRKKYSTCYTISNIYIQRLEQISKALYRQVHEQMKKNSTVRTSSANADEHRSMDRLSVKSNDRLGSSRGILRSPTMYDKVSLQKKVTWDEQSIGSQDDLLSFDSQHTKPSQTIDESKRKKNESFDHQVYWISSHNYIDNKWKIKSIEEINSFDFDPSIRALLLSDRSTINNKIKTSIQEDDDEIYECQANRWLAKDKEDGKLEVDLAAKLIHKSSITYDMNIDTKKKHFIPEDIRSDAQRHNYDDQKKDLHEVKRSSTHDLEQIERSSKGLTSRDHRLSSASVSNTSKTPLNDSHSFQRNIDPFAARQHTKLTQKEETPRIHPSIDKFPLSSSATQSSKSYRGINGLANPLNSEQELLARITGESPYHPRSSATSLSSLNQHSKSPRDMNDLLDQFSSEKERLARLRGEPSNHPRPSVTSLSPLNQHSKSPRNTYDSPNPLIHERQTSTKISDEPSSHLRSAASSLSPLSQRTKSSRSTNEQESLAKISREPTHHPRLGVTAASSTNQRLKSPRNFNDFTNPITGERESDQLSNHPRSTAIPLLSSSQNIKSSRNSNDLPTPLINTRDSLDRLSGDLPNYSRLPPTLMSSSSQRLKSPRSTNELTGLSTGEQELLALFTGEPSHRPASSATSLSSLNQRSKAPRNMNDLTGPFSNEKERLARVTGESLHRPQSPATSLSPLNQRVKSSRNTNVPTNPTINERQPLARISDESSRHPRSSVSPLLSSNHLPKPTRQSNESLGPALRPKSTVHSSPQKSVFDQVYNSAYGTAPSDDF